MSIHLVSIDGDSTSATVVVRASDETQAAELAQAWVAYGPRFVDRCEVIHVDDLGDRLEDGVIVAVYQRDPVVIAP